jgi:hypothetical protein
VSLRVAASGDHLLRDGRPFVLCADTVWSAFADAEPAEWQHYLRQRASQGFNATLVSILPIVGDRSVSPGSRPAFAPGDGRPLDPGYLRAAVRLTDAAADAGMVPVLVVAWYDYLPGERGRAREPGNILDPGRLGAYLDAVTEAFAPYEPVYVVSGDETFSGGPDGDPGPYPALLRAVHERAPSCLTTLHTTPDAMLPDALAGSGDLSFYAYQSGHDGDRQELAADLAGRYLGLAVRRPVMNLEPCYEGHGYGGGAGRFGAADVRRAVWRSVFAGASAGLGYGAHGLWQWHRPGAVFNGAWFSGEPFPWTVALGFPGAWDAGRVATLVAEHGLYLARPAQDLVRAPVRGVRAMATAGLSTVAVYAPYATGFTVAADLSGRTVTAIDLGAGRRFRPRLAAAGEETRIELPDVNGDALYLFEA